MKTTATVLGALCGASYATDVSLYQRQTNWTVGQQVSTTSGPVNGHAALNKTGVSVYLGIPYAKPPVDDLRFAAPVAYNGTETINGTNFGFSCPASITSDTAGIAKANLTSFGDIFFELLGQIGDKFSEDCLTVNVWTKPQTGDAKKAVMLWIYGGGFQSGNSDNQGYDGQYLADSEDVVVVSFNYRMNIFGFPGSPNGTYNVGLLDQRLAVEWVRDNIANFGGDPSRITLWGQSAGGASVDMYSFAWADDPIVHGFIPESGTAVNSFAAGQTAEAVAANWYNVSSTVGCGGNTTSPDTVLACMRTKPYTSILAAIPNTGGFIAEAFGPTIDQVVVFSDVLARGQAGNFAQLPMLLGSANNEAGLFIPLQALAGNEYPQSVWDQFNLAFTCPEATRANISVYNKVPTWRYRYFGDWPDLRITSTPNSGAYHASELAILFNTSTLPAALSSGIPAATSQEEAFGTYMRGAWAAFSKDPVNGLTRYGWPAYNPTGETLIRLAYSNQTGTNAALPITYDAACQVELLVNGTASNVTKTGSNGATSTGSNTPATISVSAGLRGEVGFAECAVSTLAAVFLVAALL